VSPSQTLIFSDIEGFSAPLVLPGVSAPTNLRVIDQNFDTFPDIAIPDKANHAITVLRGDGQGGILDTLVIPIGAPFGPLDVIVGNLDNVVGLDWAVLYDDTSTPALDDGGLLLYLNVSADTLESPDDIDFDALGLSKLEAKDLDLDFLREIVINTTEGNRTDWLTTGNSAPESTTITLEDGCSPIASIPAELSEDGKTDIVIFCGESKDLYYQETPASSPPPDLVITEFSGGRLRTATVGDMNGDGHLDLLAASPEGSIILALGKGDGTFTESFTIPGSQALSSMLVLPTTNAENLLMSDDVAGLLLRWSVKR
jgi:FG-GAP-like repeat